MNILFWKGKIVFDMDNIKERIEAVLFATGRVVTKEEIMEILSTSLEDVNVGLEELKVKYSSENSGIVLLEVAGGIQLVSNRKYFDTVSKFVENSKKQNLSSTCMEVLSIIAYNKNITKSEIERVRGVNSDSQVSRLLEYGLIEETGRLSVPGRPASFAVTSEFFKCMGISDISGLPEFETFGSENQIDAHNIKGQEKLDI